MEGRGPNNTTWKDEALIRDHFPYFNLEDKVVQTLSSIDRSQKVYINKINMTISKWWLGELGGVS